MKNFQKFISLIFIASLLFAACTPQATPEPPAPESVSKETGSPGPVNAVYYRQGSGVFAEQTGGKAITLAHYLWLTPNGTVMTLITPLDRENGVCGDIYSISITWMDNPDTINNTLNNATGTYSIEGDAIALNWDTYGVSFSGTYGQSNISLDVNGRTEEFVLASSGSLDNDQAWFPDDCVYDQYADSSDPAPIDDPEPNEWDASLIFYAAVLLDNGTLLLSFEGKDPIPPGNYWINVHAIQQEEDRGASECLNCTSSRLRIGSIYPITFSLESVVDYKAQKALQEEEELQTFKCQILGDYPNRLYCYGSPLDVGTDYQISFVRERPADYNVQEALTTDYFEVRSTSLPPFDFSRISGVASDLGMNEVKSVGQAWNVVGACVQTFLGGAQLPESCQWYVAYALGLGTNGFEDPFFFENPIIAFEDPFFFENPIIAFEDPFFFENPIIAFEDPFFFENPLAGFEDPFFFENPLAGFEDPFFFENPLAGFVSGITQSSNRSLGFNCGQDLNIPYSAGTYTDQVYVSALAQRHQGNSLPNACEALIVQCALTPGSGCFISPGSLGWTWPDDEEPRTTGIDCTGENTNSFYCQQVKYPEAELYTSGQACGKDVRWGTPLRTHGQYADLMFYLASVSPWLTRESLPQTCVDFVTLGARSLYGISPLAIWGSNGTSFSPESIWGSNGTSISPFGIWGSNGTHLSAFGLPLIMTMPEPSAGATLKPVVPGSDSNSCLPNGTPCNSCDISSCVIHDCVCVAVN